MLAGMQSSSTVGTGRAGQAAACRRDGPARNEVASTTTRLGRHHISSAARGSGFARRLSRSALKSTAGTTTGIRPKSRVSQYSDQRRAYIAPIVNRDSVLNQHS